MIKTEAKKLKKEEYSEDRKLAYKELKEKGIELKWME